MLTVSQTRLKLDSMPISVVLRTVELTISEVYITTENLLKVRTLKPKLKLKQQFLLEIIHG